MHTKLRAILGIRDIHYQDESFLFLLLFLCNVQMFWWIPVFLMSDEISSITNPETTNQ